jgi:glycerophosphoryl diester phosphodiesterase
MVPQLLACCALALVTPAAAGATEDGRFDVAAHRGGLGLVSESTLEAFANALELGVTTLELDVRLTEDGEPVVTHDRRVAPVKCRDTVAAFAGDAEFPYAGDLVSRLSLAQLATLDCGWQQLPGYSRQRVVPGARMPLLGEVFALADCYGADAVRFGIDPKFGAGAPGETASRGQLARVVARETRAAGVLERVTVASLDWGVLARVRKVEPRLPIVAAASPRFLEAGERGASPWLGGIDVDDFGGSLVKAAASFGADGISPAQGFTTQRMIRRAHRAGMTVTPWTVNDPTRMGELIDAGADGIISDYPDGLRAVAHERGLQVPSPAFPSPGTPFRSCA